jgi:hypothetical protein
MDKVETAKIIAYISALFPAGFRGENVNSTEVMVLSWQKLFHREPVEYVTEAVNTYARKSGSPYPPSAAEVYKLCAEISDREEQNEYIRAEREAEKRARAALGKPSVTPLKQPEEEEEDADA